MKNFKKLLALVLSVLMVASCLTVVAFAEDEETVDPYAPTNVEDVQMFAGYQGAALGGFGPGAHVGALFTVPAGKRVNQIRIQALATYANNVNQIKIEVFQWNTDFTTSASGEPLASQVVENHNDNQDFTFDLPNNVSAEGQIVFKLTYVSGEAQMTPWMAEPVEGVTYFNNGSEDSCFAFHVQYSDALPDLKCYAEIDYTKYMEDHTAVYGYGNPTHTEVKLTTDQGYATFVSTGVDPNFVYSGKGFLSQIENVTSDKLDFIVIKYRTSENGRGEFYTGRSDGVQWAAPMESSHVDWSYKTSGEWETVIVDASGVWGNVEGVTLNNFRFDYGGNCPGTFDVAYLRFYATREGAEACVAAEKQTVTETVTVAADDAAITKDDEGNAFYGESMIPLTYVPAEGDTAEHYTYEVSKTVVKAPEIPFNPADMDLRYVYDGMALAPSNVGNTQPVSYDFTKGCATYVATGDDPQVYLDAAGIEVGPYMAIKYRATGITTSDGMECFIGEGSGPSGITDILQWSFIADGEWNTKIIYIGDLADYNTETNVINHFRFDYLRGAKTSEGETMEIEYIAFFGDEDSAKFYAENNLHELPQPPKHTVTFVADGIDIAVIEFTEGDTQLDGVPEVPAKEGYEGKWEAYTLGTTDLTVNAVYTEKETEAPTEPADDPTETTQEPDEQPTEPAIEDPTEDPDGTSDGASTEAPTDGATEPTENNGCKSVIGMSAAALLAVAAAAVALKKKEN